LLVALVGFVLAVFYARGQGAVQTKELRDWL
jgi:hypothetical protein